MATMCRRGGEGYGHYLLENGNVRLHVRSCFNHIGISIFDYGLLRFGKCGQARRTDSVLLVDSALPLLRHLVLLFLRFGSRDLKRWRFSRELKRIIFFRIIFFRLFLFAPFQHRRSRSAIVRYLQKFNRQ